MTVLLIVLLLGIALMTATALYWLGEGGLLGFFFGWQAMEAAGEMVGVLLTLLASLLSGGE